MVARKRISQETFNEAVQESITEFDMTPEEAVQTAVEEFALQGVDLTGIIRSADGGNVDRHPVALALEAVTQARAGFEAKKSSDCLHSLAAALASLEGSLNGPEKDMQEQALTVAGQKGAVAEVLSCCSALRGHAPELCTALAALLAALGSEATLEDFHRADRVSILTDALRTHAGDNAVVEAAAACMQAAATKHEGTKCAFVDAGAPAVLAGLLRQPGLSDEAVILICGSLRTFATADDARPTTSRAFQNGRSVANAGVPEALLHILQGEAQACAPAVAAAVCNAMRRIAVNDDICNDFADKGGLAATLHVLREGQRSGPAVPRAACALLRQLANSDPLKEAVLAAGGLALIQGVVSDHLDSSGVLEQALGLLVSLLLRNPAAAERAAAEGCVDTVLEAMEAAEAKRGFADSPVGAQWVLRQACMALRNMVARNTELRPLLLKKGAEAHLRRAKAAHPSTCGDVGAAALRDLGFDDYLK